MPNILSAGTRIHADDHYAATLKYGEYLRQTLLPLV